MRHHLGVAAIVAGGMVTSQAALAQDANLDLPVVPDAPTKTIQEDGESPVYYRLPDTSVSPWARATFGASSRLAVGSEQASTRFSFDALAGAEIGLLRTSPASVVTEIGYSYVYESQHWFMVGIGPGLRRLGGAGFGEDDAGLRPQGLFGLTLIPHGIVGSYEGHFAYGIRTSLIARFGLAGLEVAHQYARIRELDRSVHEIHFGFTGVLSSGDWR